MSDHSVSIIFDFIDRLWGYLSLKTLLRSLMEMDKFEREAGNKQRILDVIAESKLPTDIETIRIKAGLKAWIQCKALCMELMAERKIVGQKTTKSWIFWVEKGEASHE